LTSRGSETLRAMHEYEKLGAFYLGRVQTPKGEATPEWMLLDSRSLLTHGVILGMTGSGKTGLGIALLEEAAVLMRENRISSLVVMENNRLVGIITESDIFDAFIDLLGFRDKGSRITVEAADVPGAVETIGGIFNSFNANITHIAVYRGSGGKSDVVIRTNMLNTDEIEKKLEENGYKVVHKIKSEA